MLCQKQFGFGHKQLNDRVLRKTAGVVVRDCHVGKQNAGLPFERRRLTLDRANSKTEGWRRFGRGRAGCGSHPPQKLNLTLAVVNRWTTSASRPRIDTAHLRCRRNAAPTTPSGQSARMCVPQPKFSAAFRWVFGRTVVRSPVFAQVLLSPMLG